VLSLFVLIGNPLIVLAIMGYMGYRKRTGFLAGLTVAQISEFSLIFMAMGITIGHVARGDGPRHAGRPRDHRAVGLHDHLVAQALRLVRAVLGIFERRIAFRETEDGEDAALDRRYDYVIFGLGRYGCRIGQGLKARGYRVLGIDFDPEALGTGAAWGLEAASAMRPTPNSSRIWTLSRSRPSSRPCRATAPA
jgi:hypothetical protein